MGTIKKNLHSKSTNLLPFNEYEIHPLFDDLNIGTWEYDCKTFTFYYSGKTKSILGYQNNELDFRLMDWKALIHPKDLKDVEQRFNALLNNETDSYKSEHRQLSKTGTYKWVLDYGKVLERDKSGCPIRAIGTITDITIRKEQEVDLSKNLDNTKKQNKILQNFAHISTHNLKEYAGNFESLLAFYDEAETETDKNEVIGHLKTVSNSLTKTIASLNDIVSKQNLDNLKRRELNLYACIENEKKIFETEIANKGAIINNSVDKNIDLYSNEAYLSSVIQNLASNALKYAHPDRTLQIDINSHIQEDGLLTITLADNGIGIDLNKYGKNIFKLYKTFHGNKNAEGVGLYITKNQLEALGATIDISSEVNVGTTFTITTMNTK